MTTAQMVILIGYVVVLTLGIGLGVLFQRWNAPVYDDQTEGPHAPDEEAK
jgi:hypothetical protein